MDFKLTSDFIMLLLPIIIIQLGLMVFSLIVLSKNNVKYLPKWAWALIIILGELIGSIIFLIIGREKD